MKTIVRLEGKEYQKDNLLVWQLMHPLVLERLQLGDMWYNIRWRKRAAQLPSSPDERGRRSRCRR
jgi:hypothetical protein